MNNHSTHQILWQAFSELLRAHAERTDNSMVVQFTELLDQLLHPQEPLARGYSEILSLQLK